MFGDDYMIKQNKSKTILGITAFYHDATAALIHDEKIVAMAEEERFNHQKHTKSFPKNAIQYCLKEANISIEDVDAIAFYFNPWLCFFQYLMKNNPFSLIYDFRRWKQLRFINEAIWLADFWKSILSIRGMLHLSPKTKIYYIPHTKAHLWYGIYNLSTPEGVVLVNDSMGEYTGAYASLIKYENFNGRKTKIRLKKLFSNQDPFSLGYFYGAFTKFLGFQTGHHEGKVMALASYDNDQTKNKLYQYIKTKLILLKNGEFKFKKGVLLERGYAKNSQRLHDNILALIKRSYTSLPSEQRAIKIAAATQKITNDILYHQISTLAHHTGTIVHVGGVAQNSAGNGYISDCFPKINFQVPPLPNDAGCALGAALCLYYKYEKQLPVFKETAFLGSNEKNFDIETKLRMFHIKFASLSSKEALDFSEKFLRQGKTLAIFAEKMECGPRALGHRSILADPSFPNIKDHLNFKVKFREWYRPYGGFILKQSLGKICDIKSQNVDAPYMSFVYKLTPNAKKKIPALVHIDNTCRIQTVSSQMLPFIAKLLKVYEKKYNIPILINTSLNVRGQPICCTIEDALSAFYSSGLDGMLINYRFLIKK